MPAWMRANVLSAQRAMAIAANRTRGIRLVRDAGDWGFMDTSVYIDMEGGITVASVFGRVGCQALLQRWRVRRPGTPWGRGCPCGGREARRRGRREGW